jgi:hypothetical protein
MHIQMAHLRDQGINFAVFAADAPSRTAPDRSALLSRLVVAARQAHLRVDKSALAFSEGGRTSSCGTKDLVRYLASRGGVPSWTHALDV